VSLPIAVRSSAAMAAASEVGTAHFTPLISHCRAPDLHSNAVQQT
jgi:hypothetical protein